MKASIKNNIHLLMAAIFVLLIDNCKASELSSNDLAVLQVAESKFANTKYLVLAPLDPGSSESDFDYGKDMLTQIGTKGKNFLLSSGVLLYAFNETQYRIENKLLAAFSDAEKNDLPLLVHIDFEWFTEGRPDLWNWFDPSRPGYDVQNKYNVEWSDWDKPTKKFWFNWGNAAVTTPKVCYSSPRIRQEMVSMANIISRRINTWRLELAQKQKSYLFAGVDVGWETGMPDMRDAVWAQTERDNLGFCTLHHRGFSAQNPPANFEEEVKKAVKDFIDFETLIFSNNSIPKSKIFTHIAAFDGVPGSPFPQRSPLSSAFNSNSTAGFSLYLDSHGQPMYNDQLLQNSVKGQPWAIVESPTTRNVVRYLADPNLKLISFFSWGFDIKTNAPFGDWKSNQNLVKEILNYNSGAPTSGDVRGVLDSVQVVGGKTYVSGWACNTGVASAINLHIYAGGAYPSGHFLFQASTHLAAEVGVQNACGIASANPMVRFGIEIPTAMAIQYQDQPIYIYGINLSGDGSLNKLIANSGVLKLPKVSGSSAGGSAPAPVPAPTPASGDVRGFLDSVQTINGKTFVSGWACNKGVASAIGLHLYAGGPHPSGHFLFQTSTHLAAEVGVQKACEIGSANPAVRFSIEIPAAMATQYQDQAIYIYGISLSGDGSLNKLIGNSGILKLPKVTGSTPIPAPAPASGDVRGYLDSVQVVGGKTYVSGWACNKGVASAINLHIYAGGPHPSGRFLFQASTHLAAEVGVQNACGIASANPMVRFSIEIPAAAAAQYQDQSIYIYGINLSGDGSLNKLIGNSGVLKLPKK